MNGKPSFRDWALAAVGIMFALMGFFILPDNRDLGISTIALFGVGATMSVSRVVRKLRHARQHIGSVQVIGGTRIVASRLRMASVGATCLVLGAILIIFDHAPLYIRFFYWLIAGAGLALLSMFALGIGGAGAYLEFKPAGLVLGYRSWAALLAWDRIARISTGELHKNEALFLWLDSPEVLQVTPHEKHDKFIKYVRQCRAWIGSDILIMPTQYGIDSQVLFAALTRYMKDAEARAELEPDTMPHHASLAQAPTKIQG
jgi:hypothetical protein